MGFINSMGSKFVICADVDPPKGVDATVLFRTADLLKGRIDALIVNDMPSAVMRMGSLAASYLLKERGFDTICNITCRDRNVLALQSDILSAASLGIENIYITRGDDITYGDHPRAKPVNELDDDQFLTVLGRLKEGMDAGGNKLTSAPQLNIGVALQYGPAGNSPEQEIEIMNDKIARGAAFFIVPPVFDLSTFEKFITRISKKVSAPIIAEMILLKSVATARYINKHIQGITVPDKYIDRLYSAPDKQKESIAIAAELINGLKKLCSGVSIKSMGWEEKIPSYLDAVEASA
jgi:methylenetetrahydrofolate reductase (NADPH)